MSIMVHSQTGKLKMNIKKLDFNDILIGRYDDIEKILRKRHKKDLTGAVLIHKDATHCDIAEWLCENPIDAISIVEETKRLLKQPQKQLISYEKIPRNNIFETAIVADIDHSERLTEILNIKDLGVRKAKIVSFIDTNEGITISSLRDITKPEHNKAWFLASDGYLYHFAYPFFQFLKD